MTAARSLWHLGVIYHDDRELFDRLAPIAAQALLGGRHVMVWLPRPAAGALERALRDRLGPAAQSVGYLDPLVLGADGDTVAHQLRALSARDLPALVIAPSDLAHGHQASLERLPEDRHQLICVCRDDAPHEVIEQFRRHHGRPANPLTSGRSDVLVRQRVPEPAPTLALVVNDRQGLRDLRVGLRRVLDAAGVAAARRDRAVLAVHEAALVAGRFVPPGAQPAPAPLRVRARVGSGALVADLESVAPGVSIAIWSTTELRIARAFGDQVRRSGTLHTRRLRVQAPIEG